MTGPEGDYYLSQLAAGQAVDSPCVDSGDPAGSAFGTTRTDESVDIGIPDMGVHFHGLDIDQDGLRSMLEGLLGLDPMDQDSDDDGFSDGEEYYANGPGMTAQSSGTDFDTDGDGLSDGLELGLTDPLRWPGIPALGVLGTDPAVFIADQNPNTTTDPLNPDTDGGGALDGEEDGNHSGAIDLNHGVLEHDPNSSADDAPRGILGISPSTVADSVGAFVQFDFDFDNKYANQPYLVLGSNTGSSGIVLGSVAIPLDYDPITRMTLNRNYPNPNAWAGFYGYLDSSGDGQALLLISPGDVTAYIGTTFYWSVFPIDMSVGLPTTSTNAASFQVLP